MEVAEGLNYEEAFAFINITEKEFKAERCPRLFGQCGGVNKVESHRGYAASIEELVW